jgi:uncharacterized HhH-GPD family protein
VRDQDQRVRECGHPEDGQGTPERRLEAGVTSGIHATIVRLRHRPSRNSRTSCNISTGTPTVPPGATSAMLTSMSELYLAQEPAADVMLREQPLALLIGMLLDQQIPLEKAFVGPYRLAERLGVAHLDAATIADHDPVDFAAIFAKPPAIHRFPGSMAERTQKLCRAIADTYGNDAVSVWSGVTDARQLLKRVEALPGFGKQKAQIFVALLGKQFDVHPAGWQEIAGAYGEDGSFRSVADIVDPSSLSRVREYKKQMKLAAKAAKG